MRKAYLSPLIWVGVLIAAPFILMDIQEEVGGIRNPPFAFVLSLAVFGYPAYRSFRKAQADNSTAPLLRKPNYIAIAVVAVVVLVSFIWLVGGFKSKQGPALEGRYKDPSGSTAEFLKDGTAIFIINGQQAVWTWQKINDGRMKLTPDPGLVGPTAALCNYDLTARNLYLRDCPYAMDLTRM